MAIAKTKEGQVTFNIVAQLLCYFQWEISYKAYAVVVVDDDGDGDGCIFHFLLLVLRF